MNVEEFIKSGMIEMYCMGTATAEEQKQVEQMAADHREVREEIAAVNEALQVYAQAIGKKPHAGVKKRVMEAIEKADALQFPPAMSLASTSAQWTKYLNDNDIATPKEYELIHLMDLPGNAKQVTYIVWAKKGAVVEESHAEEDEYLLMLKGTCSVTIDGKLGYYGPGEIAFIPKGCVHRAEVISDEPMLIIGQRVAA